MMITSETLCMLLAVLVAVALIVFVLALVAIKILSEPLPSVVRYESEKTFIDPISGEAQNFPFFQEEASVSLSIVVPSYNEEERLPIMLDETFEYLQNRCAKDPSFTYEVLVVDDGSKDKTTKVGLKYVQKYGTDKIRVLTFQKNRGKGGAVKMGVFCSRGANILFVDADGATKFSDLDGVEAGLVALKPNERGMAMSVGSRAHLQEEAVAKRSPLRNFLMYGFHFLVYILCVKGIKDTQCGFKLMTRQAALRLFSTLHVERWAFDVELLYLAQSYGVPIAEVAVNWQEIDGSKMIPVFSWLQMGKDILLIRLRYIIGAWKMSLDPPKIEYLN